MGNIGPLEIGIVLLIVLIIFGPKRLPGLGKSVGTGMREFKESITGEDKEDEAKKAELTQAAAVEPVVPAPVATPAPTPVASSTTHDTPQGSAPSA